jgi:hypothetical protein
VRNHLSEGMWIAALCHTEMARDVAALRTVVSSAMEFALGRSPDEIFRVEVVDDLVAEFRKLEERHSRLEQPGMRIYDPLLGPPSNQA